MLAFLIVYADDIRIVLSTGSLVRVPPIYFHPTFDSVDIYDFFESDGTQSAQFRLDVAYFPEDRVGRMKAADHRVQMVNMDTMTFGFDGALLHK